MLLTTLPALITLSLGTSPSKYHRKVIGDMHNQDSTILVACVYGASAFTPTTCAKNTINANKVIARNRNIKNINTNSAYVHLWHNSTQLRDYD